MRINKFLAQATGLSRRAADSAIAAGRVQVNGVLCSLGQDVSAADRVSLDGKPLDSRVLTAPHAPLTIILNKPPGYVVSRNGQGSHTIYDLLPPEYERLKPIGRLDKDSSGLLLLTDDGQLAHSLMHPSHQKVKVYEITLDKPLQPLHRQMVSEFGVTLADGPSRFQLERLHDGDDRAWRVSMHEGRNRQIRRTFAALGYTVITLYRTEFGNYTLNGLRPGTVSRTASFT